nr:reverse transcriptase domain-containing protein [Tanacetum cinerariifolium]
AFQPQGVSVWEGAEAVHLQAEETKLEYSRNIVSNSRETPSWREIVSLTALVKLTSLDYDLKKRAKKLKKRNRSRTHKLKRLYKVGLTARVESFDNEESLGKDASKQGRIDAVNADDEITLVNDVDNEMFDVDDLGGEEVFVAEQEVISTATTTETITTKEITLAQAFEALKTSKPKAKGNFFQEPGYNLKDLKLKEFDKIQEMFDTAFKRVNTFEDISIELVKGKEKKNRRRAVQESAKKQKVEDDKEKAELKKLVETIPDEEEVAVNFIPLAVKSPRIVDWKIHKEGKKSYYQIIRADGKSQMYMIFSQMLKSFDMEDLEDLYKLVKARYGSTRLVDNKGYLLWSDLKTMFEPHVEDKVWKRQQGYKVLEWKLYDSYGERIVGIKSILEAVVITAAQVCVNTAQLELVLLVNFNKKYAKCLLLLVEVKTAGLRKKYRLSLKNDMRPRDKRTPNVFEPELLTIVEVASMADNRIMKELLQAPTEGYGEAIVISEINTDHFEIKTNLLQLVQANPYHGFERENPHTHINNFKRITSTLKFKDVPNDVIKLMMFSYSLEARVWYDKEPPNSILT